MTTPNRSMASGTKGRSRLGHQHAPLLLVATSLAGLAAVLWAAPAWAGAVKDEPGAIQQCSYTTGSNGSQLQWLPYRPSNVQPADGVQHADGKTVLAQHITPIAAPATVPSANDAFADPFGDGKKNYVPVIPARPIESSASGNEQTIGSDGLPQFPDGMPAARSGPARVISRPVPEVIAAPQGMLRKIPVQVEIPPELERPGPKSRYKPERKIESDQQELASIREELQGKCQTPQELVSQRPLTKISNDIRATTGDFPHECGLGLETYAPRNWSPTTYTWKAAATCHKPLYFEQVAPERYGHTWGPILEPIIEGAHFFVTIPLLPYEMGVEPPGECIYSLGYYRPGDCAPFMLDPFPLSIRGALFEGAAVTGAVLLVP